MYLCNWKSYVPKLGTQVPKLGTHVPKLGTHVSKLGTKLFQGEKNKYTENKEKKHRRLCQTMYYKR